MVIGCLEARAKELQVSSRLRMEASLIPKPEHWIMDEEEEEDLGSFSSFGDDSSSSDLMEDATSSSSSSTSDDQHEEGPLYEMSSLISQLPFKRGLSKHFQGKSQSFASLSNVKCLEDLVKPERPCKKRLKQCKSYGGELDGNTKPLPLCPNVFSRTITKRASRGSFSSSLGAKKQSSLGSRIRVPPQRSADQTLLFA